VCLGAWKRRSAAVGFFNSFQPRPDTSIILTWPTICIQRSAAYNSLGPLGWAPKAYRVRFFAPHFSSRPVLRVVMGSSTGHVTLDFICIMTLSAESMQWTNETDSIFSRPWRVIAWVSCS
jgi:hypothetical protein